MTEFATQTNSPDILNDVRGFCDETRWRYGKKRRFADDWCIVWSYSELFAHDREPRQLREARGLFDALMTESWDESLEWRGNIHHRELAWCDALFMGPPTLTRLSTVTGDPRYREFGDRLWWKTTDYLFDQERGFYYRDSRYFEQKEENGEPVFWARGNGWVFGGVTRIIEDLPTDHPSRDRYLGLYRAMAGAVINAQKPDGFWPTGLLDPQRWDKPESSGTAFFVYGLAWGLNHGVLEGDDAVRAVEAGWRALRSVTDSDGRLRAIQPIGADPYDFDRASTMPYGVGAMLLATAEMYKMALLKGTPSVVVNAENPLDEVRLLETVEVDWGRLPAEFRRRHPDGNVVVLDVRTGDLLLTQVIDEDADGTIDTLLFQATLGARERKTFRVHAISEQDAASRSESLVFGRYVPERKDDFAWESDRAAYRMYGPALAAEGARAGVDVWAKRVRTPVVDEFYARGEYHTDHGKGLDGYSVGPTAGGGGVVVVTDGNTHIPPVYTQQRLIASGPVRVAFELDHGTWTANDRSIRQTTRVSLDRGETLSTFDVRTQGLLPGDRIGVGVVLRDGADARFPVGSGIGTVWSPLERPANGRVGVGAVMFAGSAETTIASDHLLITTKAGEEVRFAAGGTWSQGRDETSSDAWMRAVEKRARLERHPIEVIAVGR